MADRAVSADQKPMAEIKRRYAMRNKRLVVLGGIAIVASLLALTPDPVGARGGFGGGGFHGGGFGGGGFHGGGFAGRGFGGGGFAGRGFAGGGFSGARFAGSRAMAFGGPGFRSVGVVGRPGWGGAGWRGGWAGAGWRRGWGWGWPVAAGVAAGVVAANAWDWGYPYGGYDQCVVWNGFTWVNSCNQAYGWW
jgi:hypothetical protein